ncbi:MAG: iron-containing alcohol dehydrogenase [Syntrophales bacterium]|nr:iron-containing alcohol dehydrogenase [Syntrophales bacterium]
MEKITPALNSERLLDDPDKASLIPDQFYCPTLQSFHSDLTGLLRNRKWEDQKISVFVDGVSKASSEGGQGDLDTAFRDLLEGTNLDFEWIDLSHDLGINPGELHASHTYLDKIRPLLVDRRKHIMITLGSGSITDLVKHALCLEDIRTPLITIPTALTVTAFTSSFAILDFHGAKRTLVSRPVTAAFWIEPFLESAPSRMSRAGYGDLLARFLAYGDWFLGYRLGVMDRYNEGPFRLMEPFVPGIKSNAGGFMVHPLPREATACTAAALAMAGIAMSVAGETTPLSGFEHVISHGLDFLHLLAGRELVLHGEQVALGSVISARTIDWFLSQDALDIRTWRNDPTDRCLSALDDLLTAAPWEKGHRHGEPPAAMAKKLEAARLEFHVEYRKKSERWLAAYERCSSFADAWKDIKAELARVTMRAGEMERLVKQAGLPTEPGETTPPTTERELWWAVRFAPFVRSRMNMADLIFWMGKDPAFILPHGPA